MDIITRAEAKAQGLKWYFTGVPCKHGHTSERQTANASCRECAAAKNAANCKRWYYEKGKPQVMETAKAWAEANRARRREIAAAYSARWRQTDAYDEWIESRKTTEGRAKRNEYRKRQLRESENAVIVSRLRSRVYSAVMMHRTVKARKTKELIGCSVSWFKGYLENMFQPWMSWDVGSGWELDHIRPCASFDLTDPAQQLICFNWRNYQPLPTNANRRKNAAWTPEMEADWAATMRALGWEGDLALVFEPATMAA